MYIGQCNFMVLFVIDISGFYCDELVQCQVVVDQLGVVVCEVGFFYIIGYGIDLQFIVGLCEVSCVLFVQLMLWKMCYYIGDVWGYKGYVFEGEEVYFKGWFDYKEVFDIGFEVLDDYLLVLVGMFLIGNNKWFELLGFKEVVFCYYEVVFVFGCILFCGFVLVLGQFEDVFEFLVICLFLKLCLIYYLVDLEVVDVFGIGVYMDYECFILLLVDQFGLEVMNDQGVWIDVLFCLVVGEEVFVINIGDMFEVMIVGVFFVMLYCVCKVQQECYFFLLFFVCDYYMCIWFLLQFVSGFEDVICYGELFIGEYMYLQVQQIYIYFKCKVEVGELVMFVDVLKFGSFGYIWFRMMVGY